MCLLLLLLVWVPMMMCCGHIFYSTRHHVVAPPQSRTTSWDSISRTKQCINRSLHPLQLPPRTRRGDRWSSRVDRLSPLLIWPVLWPSILIRTHLIITDTHTHTQIDNDHYISEECFNVNNYTIAIIALHMIVFYSMPILTSSCYIGHEKYLKVWHVYCRLNEIICTR